MTLTRKLLSARKSLVLKPKDKLPTTSVYDILDITNKSSNTLEFLKSIAKRQLMVTEHKIANVRCLQFQPNYKLKYFLNAPHNPDILLIYIHGGGFIAGFIEQGTYFIKAMLNRIGCNAIAIDYSLSPEVLFPHAINQIVDVYTEIIKKQDPKKIILAGESAGGNLCMALLQKLRELNLPMPKMCVNASGFMDLTFSGESHQNNEDTDYSLSLTQLKYMAKAYICGDNNDNHYKFKLLNPLASPVFADVTGFPPTFFSASTDELLYSDTVKVVEKYKQAGIKHQLELNEKTFHAHLIMGDFYEESKVTTDKLALFIKEIFNLDKINMEE